MGFFDRLRAALRAAIREWRSHRGSSRIEGDALEPFMIGAWSGRDIKEGLPIPYYGEFLTECNGRRYALRHHGVSKDGVVRYFPDKSNRDFFYVDDWFCGEPWEGYEVNVPLSGGRRGVVKVSPEEARRIAEEEMALGR